MAEVQPAGDTGRSAPRRPIRKLDELTISRIAAGEVVERPASVVKELVENSIDAGATRIDVAIVDGGRTSIRVVDDGGGIPADQMVLAVERHATSKLDDERALSSIRTLGFRGEALAAICAVARVTIASRERLAADGWQVVVDAGRVVDQAPVGMPFGTRITVEHLFADVPARRSFLRSDAAEAGRVTEIVASAALASPDVRFTLARNGRAVFDSPGRGGLRAAMAAVFGPDVARDLIEVAYSVMHDDRGGDERLIRVRGAAGSAHVHRANRRGIHLFVNGRAIEDARLTAAIVQAYRTRIPERRFPIAAIAIEIPPDAVDVNVHPAKTEVRFKTPDRLFGVVRDAVVGALGAGRIGAVVDRRPPGGRLPWSPPAGERLGAGGDGRGEAGPAVRADEGWSGSERGGVFEDGERYEATHAGPQDAEWTPGEGQAHRPADESRTAGQRLPPLRVLGQVARCYVVAEGPDGLYVIDQHAAHERVVFERLLGRGGPQARQTLLEPVVIELAPDEVASFARIEASLSKLGFDVEAFGDSAVIVRAVPEVLTSADPAALVRDVLQSAVEDESPVERAVEERVARAACKRGSIKAGQTLSTAEILALVAELERCSAPHTCPHGRPTVITLGHGDLERSFARR